MSAYRYLRVGIRRSAEDEPEMVGIATVADEDELKCLTSYAMGPRRGLAVGRLEQAEYETFQAFDMPVWTIRQIVGTEDPPEGIDIPEWKG